MKIKAIVLFAIVFTLTTSAQKWTNYNIANTSKQYAITLSMQLPLILMDLSGLGQTTVFQNLMERFGLRKSG